MWFVEIVARINGFSAGYCEILYVPATMSIAVNATGTVEYTRIEWNYVHAM